MKPQRAPDYAGLGFADHMGPKLRSLVEAQLTEDLQQYGVLGVDLKFDWSDSCVEGHRSKHLDGFVENFSGISVFNATDDLVADGWMEFIHEGDFFRAYWEFVRTWNGDRKLMEKKDVGIPAHILKLIPEVIRTKYRPQRL